MIGFLSDDNLGMGSVTTFSGAEFDRLPYDEGRAWELIGGELIGVSSLTPEHQDILQKILMAFLLCLRSNPDTGLAYTDLEFALSEDDRVRPDVLIIGAARASRLNRKVIPIPGAPDLAVEIISPSERKGEIEAKLLAYLRFGTNEVWQVYPESRSVVVSRDGQSERYLNGTIRSPLLPGFELDLAHLFEQEGSIGR